jgi:hypothetical protein
MTFNFSACGPSDPRPTARGGQLSTRGRWSRVGAWFGLANRQCRTAEERSNGEIIRAMLVLVQATQTSHTRGERVRTIPNATARHPWSADRLRPLMSTIELGRQTQKLGRPPVLARSTSVKRTERSSHVLEQTRQRTEVNG